MNFVINLLNFTTSVNAEYTKNYVDRQTRKAIPKLSKKGASLPSAYYEISFFSSHTGGGGVSSGEHLGTRQHPRLHMVRGHFKFFKKGKMAGRALWCPPHQRGKGDYVPKIYKV
jgi:hypothetical protein